MVNFINRQSDSNSQTSLSSATTTSTSRSSKASSSSSYDPPTLKGAHYSVISDLRTEPKPKSMAERLVTDETVKVDKKAEKNKKKRLKKIAQKTQNQAQKYGHNGVNPSAPSPTTALALQPLSFFSNPVYSLFNDDERRLIRTILKGRLFPDNANLLEVLMIDLGLHWKNLMSLAVKKNNDIKEIFEQCGKINNITNEIFLFEIYFSGITAGILSKSQNPLVNRLKWLQEYSDILASITNLILAEEFSRAEHVISLASMDRHRRKYDYKNASIDFQLVVYRNKIDLITKFMSNPDLLAWLFSEQPKSCLESFSTADLNITEKINRFQKIKSFIQEVSQFNEGAISDKAKRFLVKYFNAVDQLSSTSLTKETFSNLMQTYKNYSICVEGETRKSEEFLRRFSEQHSSFGGKDLFTRNSIARNTIDKWVSDLHQSIIVEFTNEINEAQIIVTRDVVHRTLELVRLIKSEQFRKHDYMGNYQNVSPSLDSPINSSRVQIQTFIKESVAVFSQPTSSYSFVNVVLLMNKFHKHEVENPFQLSKILSYLYPLHEDFSKFSFSPQFEDLRHQLLDTIREKHKSNPLSLSEQLELKIALKKMLWEETHELNLHMMLVADMNVHFSSSLSSDILHLFSDDLVKLLWLEGFEEIFIEPAEEVLDEVFNAELNLPQSKTLEAEVEVKVAQEVEKPLNTVTTESSPLKKEAPQEKKQNPTPLASIVAENKQAESLEPTPESIKRDFQENKKRPMIIEMLKSLNIVFDHKGRHDVFRHKETSGIVVVPNDVGDPGTRNSMAKQTFAALPRRSEHKDD
jgi:hypothetical protein